MSERVSTEIKCTDCGKGATVPFKPSPDKPVYCRQCLAKHRTRPIETKKRVESKNQNPDKEKQAWSRRRESWL